MAREHDSVSRRTVLRGIGTGVAGTTLAGAAAAESGPHADDRYVVGVAPNRGAGAARRAATEVRRELDFGSIGRAIAGRFSERALEALENNPNVRYIERDSTYRAHAQTTPYGVETVNADRAHDEGETGAGADIAIIDTGIDSDHEDLAANLGAGRAFVECDEGCGSGGPFGGGNDNDCLEPWDDDNDHGSHCAGTADAVDNDLGVVGVATESTLHAVKVLDCEGSGSLSDVAAGIEYVADQGWDVASMSLGASSGDQTLRDACRYAYDEGVLLVASAGNDGPCSDCVGYPAAYDTVIAVSATDENDDLADFSSTGPEVELAAPGVDVLSTVPVDDYAEFSGTSMSCPHVSGGGAHLMANGYTNAEARQQLGDTAADVGLADEEQGHGRLDVAAALELDGDGSVAVATTGASDVTESSATLEGDLTDLGGAESAEVFFEYGPSGGDLSNATAGQTRSSSGTFSEDVTGLESDTEYEFRAVAEASDGDTDAGSVLSFTTDSIDDGGDTAPAIDEFAVSTRTTGPWLRASVDWTVSDADGDLASVTSELLDGERVVDDDSSSVSGSSAAGEHDLRTRDSADSVRLTVTDAAGNATSDTQEL